MKQIGVSKMDIGSKLKSARAAAQRTQEEVAEALGVSRQTISNWETGKTYPDIVSVIKISDLYQISLDYLLREKGEPPVSDYIHYLEESTNTVKSKAKLSKIILAAVYLGIWAFALIMFWFFISGSDAMGYSLMFLWILLPITTFVLSLLTGKSGYWEKPRWLLPLGLGVMYMLAEYATFSAANMMAFHKINLPHFGMAAAGALISCLGLGIGAIARRKRQKD